MGKHCVRSRYKIIDKMFRHKRIVVVMVGVVVMVKPYLVHSFQSKKKIKQKYSIHIDFLNDFDYCCVCVCVGFFGCVVRSLLIKNKTKQSTKFSSISLSLSYTNTTQCSCVCVCYMNECVVFLIKVMDILVRKRQREKKN